MYSKETIDNFLAYLKDHSSNDIDDDCIGELGDVLKNFFVSCKKCGSSNVFVSWEDGVDYGGYTGYSSGQKLFKCNECGNAASFWS